MHGKLEMNCVECGLPASNTHNADTGEKTRECAFTCLKCGTKFVVTVEITNVRRPARPSAVLEEFGIAQRDTKRQIKHILGAVYAVEDLGESIFIKKPGRPATYCVEFDSLRDTAHIIRIRQTADHTGAHIDRTIYED